MDYESDSSDFHFPSDTGLPKLSSPLSSKVPESRDWALDEFLITLQQDNNKPCPETEIENMISFKQYIPVVEGEDEEDQQEDDLEDTLLLPMEKDVLMDYNYGPPKLTLPTFEEKDFLAQLSQHFLTLERMELHEILKGGFTLVQNDIQSNHSRGSHHHHHSRQQQQQRHVHPFTASTNVNTATAPSAKATTVSTAPPGLSWFDEAISFGRHEIGNLDTIEMPKRRRHNFSPFPMNSNDHTSTIGTFTTAKTQLYDPLDRDENATSSSFGSEPQQTRFTTLVPPNNDTTTTTQEGQKPSMALLQTEEQDFTMRQPEHQTEQPVAAIQEKSEASINNAVAITKSKMSKKSGLKKKLLKPFKKRISKKQAKTQQQPSEPSPISSSTSTTPSSAIQSSSSEKPKTSNASSNTTLLQSTKKFIRKFIIAKKTTVSSS